MCIMDTDLRTKMYLSQNTISQRIMKNFTKLTILALLFLMSCQSHDHKKPHSKEGHTHPHKEESSAKLPNIDFDSKLAELEITLTKPSPPVANYVNITQAGNILFLAGKGPNKPEGGYVTGKVGQDLTVEEGYQAARLVGIAQLSVLKDHLGDLNKVKRILKVKGMVNATPDFSNQPEVINGFSDLMVEIFGDKGKHARAAVGMGSLPRNIAVEIEMIVQVY